MAFDVVVSGHLCLDLLPAMNTVAPEALSASGRLFEVGPMAISTGGPVSNTGLALHRLGVRVGLMAGVGDDGLGQLTVSLLQRQDPALAELITVQAGQPSSYSVVLSPGGADRTFLHCTGTNSTFGPESVPYERLEGVKLFHLGYPPLLPKLVADDGAGLAEVFRRAKSYGCVTSMDMVVPDPNSATGKADWPRILRRTLPYVDVFLPSLDEILFMMRRDRVRPAHSDPSRGVTAAFLCELADELLAMGAVVAGFKLGTLGMYLRTGPESAFGRLAALNLDVGAWAGAEDWQPAFQADEKGTTGAGDSAYAGFLTALLHRQTPAEALRWACAVGGCNVEAVDSTSGVQPLAPTLARLRAGWPVRPERLAGWPT